MHLVKVVPKSHKMKNKCREHGYVWRYLNFLDEKASIETLNPVHHGKYPYSVWVGPEDCELISLDDGSPKHLIPTNK